MLSPCTSPLHARLGCGRIPGQKIAHGAKVEGVAEMAARRRRRLDRGGEESGGRGRGGEDDCLAGREGGREGGYLPRLTNARGGRKGGKEGGGGKMEDCHAKSES